MMRVSYCVLIFFTAAIFSSVSGKSFFVEHKSSKKYVALYNGTTDALVSLTPFVQFAQPFQIKQYDDGSVSFITEDGLAVWDKSEGCAFEQIDIGYYTTISGLENQLFSINNHGTIGSRCCVNCLVIPSDDYSHLVIRNYSCVYEDNNDWLFAILPNESNLLDENL